MKTCTHCGEEKSLDSFSFIRKKNRHGSWCKACSTTARMEAYYKDPAAHRAYGKKREKLFREEIQQFRTPCVFCGEAEIACLDFHHKDPAEKEFSIAAAMRAGRSHHQVREEIAKCISVCSNCHRKIHAGIIQVQG